MTKQGQAACLQAKSALSTTPDYKTFIAKLGAKDSPRFEQQVRACETKLGEAVAERWRRLGCVMFALATNPPKLSGAHTVQFYIADGKYRKQVFALHAIEGGSVAVYVPQVLDVAIKAGLILKPTKADGNSLFKLADSSEFLSIEQLDTNTAGPEMFWKDMTGWNRKALRITLPPNTSDTQMQMVEMLCALASLEWAAKAV